MQYVLSLFLFVASAFGAITVKPMEIGEREGLHGNTALSFDTKRGNTTRDSYKASAKVFYDEGKKYVAWSEVSFEYGATDFNKDTNKLYFHSRYIHAITKEVVRAEAFFQVQEDEFRRINNRTLLGGGSRFKIFEVFKDAQGYFGLGGFYEHISYNGMVPKEDNFRLNAYFNYTMKFENDASLSYSFLLQPKINDFNDYVDLHNLSLEIVIYKELYLNLQLVYEHDAKPVAGVENYDFSQTTSFMYKF